jgi:acyl carrier protein phosphodiesterase
MNYLAHAFLSSEDNYILTGNIVTDMIKGNLRKEMNPIFSKGIELHHAIDRFTDSHPIVKEMIRLIHPRFHKYSPVVNDIYMDYLLVKNWSKYSSVKVEDFIESVFLRLTQVIELLPKAIYDRIYNMIQHKWLLTYRTVEGIEYVFERMKYRLTNKEIFYKAVEWLEANTSSYEESFIEFMPEIVEFSRNWELQGISNINKDILSKN